MISCEFLKVFQRCRRGTRTVVFMSNVMADLQWYTPKMCILNPGKKAINEMEARHYKSACFPLT